jgi:lysosomal acid lipase/cholesteryl ester hydrolase
MKALRLMTAMLFACSVQVEAESILTESDVTVSLKHYVERYGYGFDEFLLTTDDGYKVTLQRISTCTGSSKNGPPVLMMHGHEGSSADFLMNWPEKSPALILVENGYDIWLGNNRGNAYSKGHVTLTRPEDKDAFWNFDFEDMG